MDRARMEELRRAAKPKRSKSEMSKDELRDSVRDELRQAMMRDYTRSHPPPGLDRLSVEKRRDLLGDAYMG